MKKVGIYRKPMQEGVFEEEFTLEALSAMGNPLEQVSSLVNFELFRPALETTSINCQISVQEQKADAFNVLNLLQRKDRYSA